MGEFSNSRKTAVLTPSSMEYDVLKSEKQLWEYFAEVTMVIADKAEFRLDRSDGKVAVIFLQ